MSNSPAASTLSLQTASESIIEAIIEAVIDVHGSKPETPLYQVIDPDALEQLYQRSSPTVQFEYIGYQVTIEPNRTVLISEQA